VIKEDKSKYQPIACMRILPNRKSCDMQKYHKIFRASKTFDKLEQSVILKKDILLQISIIGILVNKANK
jgi:hypothetical protein